MPFLVFPILCGKILLFLVVLTSLVYFSALCVLGLCPVGKMTLWSVVHLSSPARVPMAGVDGKRKVRWVSSGLSGFLFVVITLGMSIGLGAIVLLWSVSFVWFRSFGLWVVCICCGALVVCRVFGLLF